MCLSMFLVSVPGSVLFRLLYVLMMFNSSPEPKAHRWDYNIPMVRRPPSSIKLKNLLRNRLANQIQVLCRASLGRKQTFLHGYWVT